VSAALADAFATDPILQWLAPSQRGDKRLRQLLETELTCYVFPAGRVLTTSDFRGANLELPPSRQLADDCPPLRRDRPRARSRHAAAPREATPETLRAYPPSGTALLHSHLGVATRFQGHGLGTACCVPHSNAATKKACPPTSKRAPNAARPSISGSDSPISANSASQTDPASGQCDGPRQRPRSLRSARDARAPDRADRAKTQWPLGCPSVPQRLTADTESGFLRRTLST
jgi:hypothetical protein